MAKEQSQIRERKRVNLKEPRRYKVIIFNDDFTTMEFVVMILVQVFLKSEEEANALMLQVHHSDKAVVGIYSYDIAVSKARKATKVVIPIEEDTFNWWDAEAGRVVPRSGEYVLYVGGSSADSAQKTIKVTI